MHRETKVARAMTFALLGLLSLGQDAFAQLHAPDVAQEQADEATRLFAKGSQQLLARRYAEALDSLRASYRLVPSPNSGLLIARCLRRLGQPVEAAETYAMVEADAKRRAEQDPDYTRTAEAAAEEGAAVRSTLGSIRIHVPHPPAGTRLDVDGVPVPLRDDGDVLVWHAAGGATIRLRSPSGAEQSRVISVQAGSDTRQDFEVRDASVPSPTGSAPAPIATPLPQRPEHDVDAPPSRRAWAVPAALVAGGVGVVGLGVFAGFGSSSHKSFTDLNRRCGPHGCGDAERSEIETGRRNQTIANTGLVIGIVSSAAAVTLVVLHLTAPRDMRTVETNARLVVGPGTAALYGSFD
jgi:hypothetical protein